MSSDQECTNLFDSYKNCILKKEIEDCHSQWNAYMPCAFRIRFHTKELTDADWKQLIMSTKIKADGSQKTKTMDVCPN
jgi:hypothetical protein